MKTVVITGATSGIGNLLVKKFVEQGCIVFAGYRNIKLKKELEKISKNVIPFYIDMSKKWTISDAVRFISRKTDKIDTLINAAGCVYAGAMECLSVDRIREQFEVNTFSHLQLTQGLIGKMQGGKVINISSMASFGIFPFVAPYCASKRAMDILFNLLQIECYQDIKVVTSSNDANSLNKFFEDNEKLAEEKQNALEFLFNPAKIEGGSNVKVISIKPGVIKTPLWEKSIEINKELLADSPRYQKEYEFLMKNAQANSTKGLDPQAVVNFIVKVESLQRPKPSYTIGFDAKVAEFLSHLPQSWINFIVQKNFEKRCRT